MGRRDELVMKLKAKLGSWKKADRKRRGSPTDVVCRGNLHHRSELSVCGISQGSVEAVRGREGEDGRGGKEGR
jgi:hypothetical protein